MPHVDVLVQSDIDVSSIRVNQVSAAFDVPVKEKQSLNFKLDVPIEEKDWNVGLIVGPSGSGKSTVARELFGEEVRPEWSGKAVVDDFTADLSVEDITTICSAVGFNTIPAWLRPFHVLSNGEQFRVDCARRLSEAGTDPILIDEFTSVVDRQVAKVASHSIQKAVRRNSKQLVAATCHYDVIDWLQPDWIVDMADKTFRWRSVQQRPKLNIRVARVPYSVWSLFAPFHYMKASLNPGAQCWAMFVEGRIAAFVAVLHKAGRIKNIKTVSRAVVLPDYQGLGLIFVLCDIVGSMYLHRGMQLRCYPAHAAFIRAYHRSPTWEFCHHRRIKAPKTMFQPGTQRFTHPSHDTNREGATFVYSGPPHPDMVLSERMCGEKMGRV